MHEFWFVLFFIPGFFSFVFGITNREQVVLNVKEDVAQRLVQIPGNSTILIKAVEIPLHISSLIIEAHAQMDSISLSLDAEQNFNNKVTGRNIGLSRALQNSDAEVSLWLRNPSFRIISVLIIMVPLNSSAPIPGGCNMEFSTEIAPYLRLRYDRWSVYLEYQHANVGSLRNQPNPLCSQSIAVITYDVYILFLKEKDFGEEEYIKKIVYMSHPSSIKKHATKVNPLAFHPDTRLTFFKYPDVGVVYNVIAKHMLHGKLSEAAYIPIATYGCDFTIEHECRSSAKFGAKFLLFILSIYGFIITFFGHQFFQAEMFFFGYLAFTFVVLICLLRWSYYSELVSLEIAAGVGVFGGLFWLFLWKVFHIPVISLLLVGFVLGFLVSSTILFTPLGNIIFAAAINFWLMLFSGTLLITIISILHLKFLSIVASSFVGSYITLLFYDDFIGTRLSYIILNVLKRTLTEKLTVASNNYPLQLRDILMAVTWAVLTIIAVIVQCKRHFSCTFSSSCNSICSTLSYRSCAEQVSLSSECQRSISEPLVAENNRNYETFRN